MCRELSNNQYPEPHQTILCLALYAAFFELSILLQLNCKNFLRGSVLNVNYAARLFNNEVNFAGTLLKRLAVTHN